MRRIAMLFTLAALVACGETPTGPDFGGLEGFWTGSSPAIPLIEVSVAPPGTGDIAGCVAFGYDPEHRPDDRVTVSFSGTLNGLDVTLATDPDQAVQWAFSGTRTDRQTISGPSGVLTRASTVPAC